MIRTSDEHLFYVKKEGKSQDDNGLKQDDLVNRFPALTESVRSTSFSLKAVSVSYSKTLLKYPNTTLLHIEVLDLQCVDISQRIPSNAPLNSC